MRNTARICIAIALLGLSACSQKNAGMGEAAVASPVVVEGAVVVEEAVVLERKSSCVATDMDDGIGGTGCPVID